MLHTALDAGVSPETLRKIESGRVATPAFPTIAAIAGRPGAAWTATTGAPAIRWQGRSDGSYTLEPLGHDVEPGTSVHLRARPDGAELLDPATVRGLAEKFGGLLPWPVTHVLLVARRPLNT